MEEGGNFNGSSNQITDELEFEEDIQNSEVFSQLKQHCIQLLDLLHNPKKDGSSLSQLLRVLKRYPPHSLQPFMDYTLFPLLLLFDAAVNCRSSVKFDSRHNSLGANTLGMAQKLSDSVAEGVVFCLEEVLKKCYLGSLDQMVVVLKKLTHGAMLSPLEASEEFREGVIRCFRALLLNLCPCPDVSCPCKQIVDCPVIPAGKELQFLDTKLSKCNTVSGECLLAFLQSEPASAAVGHWLSLLLKAADIEAARGHQGSPQLRIEALITLRVLVAKVGTVDALAFYLPGVVSQMGKILHASRSMVSGAAGSTEALDQAITGLTEYLIIVLEDFASSSIPGVPVNEISDIHARTEKPLASILDELRQLPLNNTETNDDVRGPTENQSRGIIMPGRDNSLKSSDVKDGSLRVKRTADWLANTTAHVSKLLSATYPHLCVHPSRKVRLGLLASVKALLSKCSYTLKESRLMLLECLCIFVCDDFEDVSSEACAFFRLLGQYKAKPLLKHDIAEVFSRLLEKLPQVILGNDESLALSHARKLLAVAYFGGPQLIADCVLISPVSAARFLDIFSLCFSQNSVYAGSLNKLAVARPSLSGFMHSISEIKAIISADDEKSHFLGFQNRKNVYTPEPLMNEYELPRMPPWFVHEGSQKLYQTLAGILRLVSLYTFTDSETEGSYSGLIDILMGHLRELISELRTKEHGKNSWQTWYRWPGSGRLVRQASTAVCLLNELMFGLSDRAVMSFGRMFGSSPQDKTKGQYEDALLESWVHNLHEKRGEKKTHLIDCIGGILHEYLSPEIWDLPLGPSASLEQSGEDGNISLHFFSDNGMLHQVIIEGIGIFNICLGEQFSSSGFLHSSLYMLLENVICSNFQVKRAADAVLHAVSAMQNCPTVGHLVLANSDYIIDSVCRQLRHLDLNRHVPNVLSAMLSYVGVADKILPLLEEPMHSVSMELEILGRHRHPDLTLPFLKAVAEIAKASKREANKLPNQAESFKKDISSKIANAEKREGTLYDRSESYANDSIDTEKMDTDEEVHLSGSEMQEEEWEKVIFRFNDSKRYRRIVGSIAGSCLIAVTPLITSADPAVCLTTLSVIEDGIIVLAKVEEAYKHESETKEMIEQVIESCSFHSLMDTLGAVEDETQENRLLPAMNKIWPFLVACFRSKNLMAIRQCCRTIASIIQICGGDFFSRRFHTDGSHIWKHLTASPFQTRPPEKSPLKLPYRKSSSHAENPPAETSNIKVQAAILNMISDLARNKKSASSLEAVLKKVSGIVVGIACSGVKGLQDSCVNALVGLASNDPDLIWLLLADVYYSRKKNVSPLPPSPEFPELGEVLPPPGSSKEYLYVLYGGQSFGFDVDFSAVETVFDRLYVQVFTSQMYK